MTMYVDGIKNIVETQKSVAQRYLDDRSVEFACPPIYALLHIMATGAFEGKDIQHPDIRELFNKTALLESDWYQERLETQKTRDAALWERHIKALEVFDNDENHTDIALNMDIKGKLLNARKRLETINSPAYINSLTGTIGADPV